MEQGGHVPVWHLTAHLWWQPSRGFMQVDLQVGTGSVHAERKRVVLGGKKGAEEGSRVCLPQGHVLTTDGERGHGSGTGEGS